MPIIILERKRDQTEMQEVVEGVDPEGCGGYLPHDRQLDRPLIQYLKENTRYLQPDVPGDDDEGEERYSVRTSWKKGRTQLDVIYEQLDDGDWPCDYPQREELKVILHGRMDPSLIEVLKKKFFLEEIVAA